LQGISAIAAGVSIINPAELAIGTLRALLELVICVHRDSRRSQAFRRLTAAVGRDYRESRTGSEIPGQ